MTDLPEKKISFAEFELDTTHRRLLRGGETVVLQAKAFDLLAFLVANKGRVVSKDEILETVWAEQFVEESNLVVQISALRKALGETKNTPRFLVTVPGKGYKFAAETNESGFLIATHTISELTIKEEIHTEESAPIWKWLALAAAVILTVGAFGFWRYQSGNAQNSFASGWINPANRAAPRRLTANGKINVAAISPDGTLYAYTTEGSEKSGLWVGGITGAQIIEVIAPTAIAFSGLTFAPDGLHIYYTARDEKNPTFSLFRVPTFGGLPEKVLSDVCCAVTFSPDGKQFAFRRGDSNRKLTAIVVANAQGSADEREIAVRPGEFGFNDNGASWSPDGTKIAIGAKDEKTGENAVFLVDVNSGTAEKFGEKAWNDVRRVQWMPDGSGLFVNVIEKESWQERQIWLIEYPNGAARRITNDLNRYGSETVSISADGTKLLAVSAQTISNIFTGAADDTSNLKNITNNSIGKNDGNWNSLTFAPDGRLIFMRFFDKSDTIWTMNADGTNAKQITPSGSLDRKPAVTNDGRYVVFYSVRGGKNNIWRVNADGSDLKQITTDGGIVPSVTPDGSWIFYQKENFIWKIPIDGGTPFQMTNNASRSVEISPDGKMFATFYRQAKGEKLKLAVFPIEGGEPIYLFDSAADLPYEKFRWTPDSQSLVYCFYNSTAWKQNISGGAPEKFLEFPGEVIYAFAWSFDSQQFAVAHGQEVRDVVLFTNEKP